MPYIPELLESHFRARQIHQQSQFNALILVGFTEAHLDWFTDQATNAVFSFARRPVVVDARGKTLIMMCKEATGRACRSNACAENFLCCSLISEDAVLIVRELSAARFSHKHGAGNQALSFIKWLDDLARRGSPPKGDLVFIDYTSFLETNWESLGPYANFNVEPLSPLSFAKEIYEQIDEDEPIPTVG